MSVLYGLVWVLGFVMLLVGLFASVAALARIAAAIEAQNTHYGIGRPPEGPLP